MMPDQIPQTALDLTPKTPDDNPAWQDMANNTEPLEKSKMLCIKQLLRKQPMVAKRHHAPALGWNWSGRAVR
jgi:hypothetical protein